MKVRIKLSKPVSSIC